MKPIRTNTTNCILKGNNDNVDDLPVTRVQYGDGTPAVESCWELSKEEIDQVSKTGKLYFLCLGTTHPPILPKVEPWWFKEE
jgi:hypothetical protein